MIKRKKQSSESEPRVNIASGDADQSQYAADYVKENWETAPLDVLVNLFSLSCEDSSDFMVKLVLFLYRGLQLNAITREDLFVIGIDLQEISSMTDAISSNSNYSELKFDLKVRAAIREYEKIILKLMQSNNLNLDMFDEFKVVLTKFASENSMSDLNAAFKFISATEGDSLTRFKL